MPKSVYGVLREMGTERMMQLVQGNPSQSGGASPSRAVLSVRNMAVN